VVELMTSSLGPSALKALQSQVVHQLKQVVAWVVVDGVVWLVCLKNIFLIFNFD
jgi:hypothetical protein